VIGKIAKWSLIGLVVLFAVIQAVPYGRAHKNPAVTQEAPWQNADAKAIAQKACYDCHSNRAKWRWYTYVAPFSWLSESDVNSGRKVLNFSQWDKFKGSAGEAIDQVQSGEMPPWFYWIVHWNARLSGAEKATLVQGLKQLP